MPGSQGARSLTGSSRTPSVRFVVPANPQERWKGVDRTARAGRACWQGVLAGMLTPSLYPLVQLEAHKTIGVWK